MGHQLSTHHSYQVSKRIMERCLKFRQLLLCFGKTIIPLSYPQAEVMPIIGIYYPFSSINFHILSSNWPVPRGPNNRNSTIITKYNNGLVVYQWVVLRLQLPLLLFAPGVIVLPYWHLPGPSQSCYCGWGSCLQPVSFCLLPVRG